MVLPKETCISEGFFWLPVVKSSHSVIVLKLLLQALAMSWKPDTDAMTTEISQNSTAFGSPLSSVCDNVGRLMT